MGFVTVYLTCSTSVTAIRSSSSGRIPPKEDTGWIRSHFAPSLLFIHWGSNTTSFGSSTNNFWLLVVHLSFRTTKSVHLCTTDFPISLSGTDTVSEHLPTADIANREPIHICEGQLSSLIHTPWQVHVFTPNKLHLFPFNISTSQRSTTSLSSHLLGCLVRDLNYGPWPVKVCYHVAQTLILNSDND